MEERRICSVVLAKWADYRPALPSVHLRFLAREPYLESARHDRRVREELAVGWFEDFEAEFRDPVLADPDQPNRSSSLATCHLLALHYQIACFMAARRMSSRRISPCSAVLFRKPTRRRSSR